MKSLEKTARDACDAAFDEGLGTTAWAKEMTSYKLQKEKVRKEAFQAQFTRFTSQHENRLNRRLQTGLQHAKALYNERAGAALTMPITKENVELQHNQMVSQTVEYLRQHAEGLTDTDAYNRIYGELEKAMNEGKERMHTKNIELWKVHSDAATTCAKAANEKRMNECGWFCLFKSIPWWHQAISRRNLLDCFPNHAISAKMDNELKEQVFQAWYTKDLAKKAAEVSSRFYWTIGTIAFACAGFWWYFR